MEQKKFEITLELLNKIGAYLGSRPYVEVAQLLNELSLVKPVVEMPTPVEMPPEVKAES